MPRMTVIDCDPYECLFHNNFLRPDTFINANNMDLFIFDNNDDEMVFYVPD